MENSKVHAGPIILMGSGETAPSSGTVFEEVAKLFKPPVRIAIVETPAGFELNSSRVAGRVGDFLQNRLQNYRPVVDIIPARKIGTVLSPDSPEILEPLYQADIIFMGPGSPTYAARQLNGSLAYEIIQARQRTGAALVLASAATIAFGCQTMPIYEIYKAGMDLHWQPGLNYFQQFGLDLVIVPHWNNAEGGVELDTSRCFMGAERFDELCSLLTCEGTILGIDEHTSIWIDINASHARVFGKGNIHMVRNGKEETFSSGDLVPANHLGDYHQMTDIHSGVRKDIWEKLVAIKNAALNEIEEKPPESVLEWARLRESARKSSDYSRADELRIKVKEAGWQIKDTASGFKLEKQK